MEYFSADQHFYHKKIMSFVKRPFNDIDSMTTGLIKRHNEVVKQKDATYFLGDFAFVRHMNSIKAILDQMNGKKILIKGNHDRLSDKKYRDAGFIEVHKSLWWRGFYLAHSPDDNYFNCRCICGHVHDLWKYKGKMINVGVDVWDFYPVSANVILTKKEN